MDYKIVSKSSAEFQKLLNQWKNIYEIEVIWCFYSNTEHKFIAIIKRKEKCLHGTMGGRKHCIKCKAEDGFNG